MGIVNRTGLARDLGVNLSTVDHWVRKGCPVIAKGSRGKEWKFDTAAVHAWDVQQKIAEATGAEKADGDELRRRKLQAETELAEIEVAKARELVVGVSQVQRNQANIFAEIQINLRNIPNRIAASIIGLTDERAVKAIILAEIDLTLTALADSETVIVGGDDEPEDGLPE